MSRTDGAIRVCAGIAAAAVVVLSLRRVERGDLPWVVAIAVAGAVLIGLVARARRGPGRQDGGTR